MSIGAIEIEFKYHAESLAQEHFINFCKQKDPIAILHVSGSDKLYSNPSEPNTFFRYRGDNSGRFELTFKRKTNQKNNYIRAEHNIALAASMSSEKIGAFLQEFGYSYNFTIFKNSIVAVFETFLVAYYRCYNVDMEYLGAFVEIEVNEEYPWNSEQEAWNTLVMTEEAFKTIGCDANNRLDLSLFEMYRKQDT